MVSGFPQPFISMTLRGGGGGGGLMERLFQNSLETPPYTIQNSFFVSYMKFHSKTAGYRSCCFACPFLVRWTTNGDMSTHIQSLDW